MEASVTGSEKIRELAHQLCHAYTNRVEFNFHRVDKKLWGLTLQWLIEQSMFDVAKSAAPRLAIAYPEMQFFQTMGAVLARLPPPCDDSAFAAFCDDGAQEVQIIPRVGATAVLFAFCGGVQKLGLSLNLIHRWFGQLGVHVIYLRDYQFRNYDRGIGELAPDLDGTLRTLRQLIADLGVVRSVCYGNSMGCYGALRYALELESEATLCMAGPTNLSPDFGNSKVLQQLGAEPGLDLRPLYQAASKPPRTHLVYAECHDVDRTQALNFVGLSTVSLEKVPGASIHNVLLPVLFGGRYESLIQWLVNPNRGGGMP